MGSTIKSCEPKKQDETYPSRPCCRRRGEEGATTAPSPTPQQARHFLHRAVERAIHLLEAQGQVHLQVLQRRRPHEECLRVQRAEVRLLRCQQPAPWWPQRRPQAT